MRIKLLTKINACIALLLGALGVTSCGSGILPKRNSGPEAMYGPPEDMYGVPYVNDTIPEVFEEEVIEEKS
ncbi:MAG: hypothetical protein IJ915_05535 [Paludibacteraceae bacterium]|nr:hypothetical protein [Paludibacteraceae bacterium]